MTEIVSLVTSIAACLSAIAALVVVRQNYKQRTASYRPELVLVKTPVRLQRFEETSGFPHIADENIDRRVSVPIVNVGLGAARDVKISWKFPVGQVVSSVNRLAQKALTRAYFEYKHGLLSMEPETRWVIHWKVEREEEIDFVLPASIQQAPPNQLNLPMTYVALVFGLNHFAFKSQSSSFPDVLPLECRLEYSDIGGAQHVLDLVVHMKAVMISDNEFACLIHSSRRDA